MTLSQIPSDEAVAPDVSSIDLLTRIFGRILDSPLMLMTFWPLWVWVRQTWNIHFDLELLVIVAGFVAGRRWGAQALLPLALSCWPFLAAVTEPSLGTLMPGNVWTIASVFLAFRMGMYADLPYTLTSRPWSGFDRISLVCIFLAGLLSFQAFADVKIGDLQTGPDLAMSVRVFLNPWENYVTVLAVLIGLSRVSLRPIAWCVLGISVLTPLTTTFWPPQIAWRAYIDVLPGLWPGEPLKFVAVAGAVRFVQTRGASLPSWTLWIATLLALTLYVWRVKLQVPMPDFHSSLVTGQFAVPSVGTLSDFLIGEIHVSLLMGFIAWRWLSRGPRILQRDGLAIRVSGVALAAAGLWTLLFYAWRAGLGEVTLPRAAVALPAPLETFAILVEPPSFVLPDACAAALTGLLLGGLVWAYTGQVSASGAGFGDVLGGRNSVFVSVIGRGWALLAVLGVAFSFLFLGFAYVGKFQADRERLSGTDALPAFEIGGPADDKSAAQPTASQTQEQQQQIPQADDATDVEPASDDLPLEAAAQGQALQAQSSGNAIPAGIVLPPRNFVPFRAAEQLANAGLQVFERSSLGEGDVIVSLATGLELNAIEDLALDVVTAVPEMRQSNAFFIGSDVAAPLYSLEYGRFENASDAQMFCDAIPYACSVTTILR